MQHRKEPIMSSLKHRLVGALAILSIALGAAVIYTACLPDGDPQPRLMAKKVTSRQELIGGPVALGEIGDYLIENDEIRVVIEDVGYASGSGLFGGSLIDIDLQRPNAEGNAFGGNGMDTFGEFFPAYFLEMVNPEEVVVINDGSNGEAAVVEVRGRGGEFVTMLRFINQAMVNSYDASIGDIFNGTPASSDGEPLVRFTVRYILEPGARHVKVESSLINASGKALDFPNGSIKAAIETFMGLNLDDFSVPMGSVLGFGALNSIFLPDIGYDLRWGLEDAYMQEIELPAFPGKVSDFVASSNTDGANYGFIAGRSEERNFVNNKSDIYGDTDPDDMLMLFYASGFGGVLTHDMPGRLEPEESFTFTNYVIVGDGDVASILDEAYKIREVDTQKVGGRIFDSFSGEPVGEDVSLLVYRARADASSNQQRCSVDGEGAEAQKPRIYSQAFTNAEGYFRFTLPPGHYCYRTRDKSRPLSDYVHFEVREDKGTYLRPEAQAYGAIEARILDATGNPIPAKVVLVGTHEYRGDMLKRHFLFDLEAGEPWRTTDMIPDEADDEKTRRFVEALGYASADGVARLKARPGTYLAYFSRGIEYDIQVREVTLTPGKIKRLNIGLDRVVDTSGYLSGDFHMHARGSIDSGLNFDDRVISIAAEGVEVVASSDHNHISDYEPYIYRNDLQNWLNSVVGVELTTFEFGHFNAFPIEYDVGSVNGGSVPWQRLPPQKIFDELRKLGSVSADKTIVQINHPRDSILGYFGQYNVDPFSTRVKLPFQEATGQEKLIDTLSTSTGPAYLRDCTADGVQCRGNERYETTFSWDFDAIEIFNGKHLEQLRHYRIPYGPGEWPEEVAATVIENTCLDEFESELDDFCADNDIDEESCTHPLDGHTIGDWCSFDVSALEQRFGRGDIMCDGDEVAYPGALDDWYNTLNYPREFIRGDDLEAGEPVYRKYTATGNRGGHASGKHEFRQPGSPRNYFYVGHDDPTKMTDFQLARALKNHRNVPTNGPFVDFKIGEATVGDETRDDDGSVELDITVRAAEWVARGDEHLASDRNPDVDFTLRVMANGEPLELDDDGEPTVLDIVLDDDGEFTTTVTADIDQDTWFVVEVEGDNSLFPIYTPQEIPQVAFDAAIGSIAGSFGFGSGLEGLSPTETFPLTPFAFTNPIWVIYDQGDDTDGKFTPPTPDLASCDNNEFQANRLMLDNMPRRRLDAVQVPVDLHKHIQTPLSRKPGDHNDLRLIWEHWGGHSH